MISCIVSNHSSRWGLLAVICLYTIAQGITYFFLPPVLSLVLEDLEISHAQAGLLTSIFHVPGIVLAIPLSLWSYRFGKIKLIGLISLATVMLGCAVMYFAGDFTVLLLGRLLLGLTMAASPIVGQMVLARAFMRSRLGLAMGIYSAFSPTAALLSYISFGSAGLFWGWRVVILITLAIVIITFAVFALFFKTPAEERLKTNNAAPVSYREIFKLGWPVLTLMLTSALFNLANMSFLTFLPDFIYEQGVDLRIAGSISSILIACSLVICPFTGYLLDRTRYKLIYISAGATICSVFIFLLPVAFNLVILSVLMIGIFSALIPPTVMAVIPQLAGRGILTIAYSINYTLMGIAMFLGPYFTGLITDATGSYQYSYWFIASIFLLVCFLPLILLVRQIRRKQAVD